MGNMQEAKELLIRIIAVNLFPVERGELLEWLFDLRRRRGIAAVPNDAMAKKAISSLISEGAIGSGAARPGERETYSLKGVERRAIIAGLVDGDSAALNALAAIGRDRAFSYAYYYDDKASRRKRLNYLGIAAFSGKRERGLGALHLRAGAPF
jgi:hypothetical protein